MKSSLLRSLQTMSSTNQLVSISSLPLPPRTHLLPNNLTPDPHTPTPSTFLHDVLTQKPSIQRRARLLSPQSHFSYVSPLPLPFPYDIRAPDPKDVGDKPEDKAAYVERWLSMREATHAPPEGLMQQGKGNGLTKYYPENRDQFRLLIGLAETGLKDCLPQLDVGDSFEILGKPVLLPLTSSRAQTSSSSNPNSNAVQDDVNVARQDLIDILSGHAVLMSDSHEAGFAPWSLRYSGHQFGTWAGQLGDGRAISIRKYAPSPTIYRSFKKMTDPRAHHCSGYPSPIRS
jgi:serine/tyrosine/threonine adenylyltransferase